MGAEERDSVVLGCTGLKGNSKVYQFASHYEEDLCKETVNA